MSSGNKPGPESDTDSMAEYGEGETGMSPRTAIRYFIPRFKRIKTYFSTEKTSVM